MSDNVLKSLSCPTIIRIGILMIVCLTGLTIAAAETGTLKFISANYNDVFCGAPLPKAPAITKQVVVPKNRPSTIIDVNIFNSAFDPQNLTINVGDTVRWTNNDGRAHTSTSDTAVWDSGSLGAGESFSFTFNTPGSFPYQCIFHAGMIGSITVQPAGPSVSILDFAFNPSELTINVGDTVTWTNNDSAPHTTTSDTAVWDSGVLNMGQTFSFTFTNAGVFPYSCGIHPAMTGTITVLSGSPTPTATNTATPTATATGPPAITGTITYGNAVGNPIPPRFVKNVSVASTAGSPAVGPVVTGTPGTYALTGFGAGSYTIKPTKPGGANAAISSLDAARVAQGVSGASPFVSNNQRFSADTTGNGSVSSQDAAKLAQFVAGLPMSPPNLTGEWRFFVSNLPAFPAGAHPQERTYASVSSVATGEDYIGILIGDVSGNWNPATHPRPVHGPERSIVVELPQITTSTDKEIVVPINVQSIADKNVISYEFDLRYDPSVMQPSNEVAGVKSTASRGLVVVTNPVEPGLLRVVVYGAFPITEDGVLLNLRFTAVGSAGSASPLSFERIMFNEGEPRVTATEGRIEIF